MKVKSESTFQSQNQFHKNNAFHFMDLKRFSEGVVRTDLAYTVEVVRDRLVVKFVV